MSINEPTDKDKQLEKQQVHLGMFRRLYRNPRTGKLHLAPPEKRKVMFLD